MRELTAVLQPRFSSATMAALSSADTAKTPQPVARRPVEADFDEAVSLTRAINLPVAHSEIVPVRSLSPATLFGKGAVERLGAVFRQEKIRLVFVNAALTPIQQRNLEQLWKVKVIDRQGLILEIFSARAKTREGRLQLELAMLLYQRSRLVRAWSHLERQRGGLGKTGGPGEMQKELDRRKLDERIKHIRKDLDKVVLNRTVQRQARERVPFPVVALVGYTNAGKSTLFNKMTAANVMAKDLLFATLDTTLRAVRLPSGRIVILSDTVGFISNLPPELVAAFRATLEETIHADLILHVRDIAAPYSEAERNDVIETLGRMKLDSKTRIREVWNKCDLLDETQRSAVAAAACRARPPAFAVSAISGEGLEKLLQEIDTMLADDDRIEPVELPLDRSGEALAWLYRNAQIIRRQDHDHMIALLVRISPAALGRFKVKYPVSTAA